jgi:hypothetical protein
LARLRTITLTALSEEVQVIDLYAARGSRLA